MRPGYLCSLKGALALGGVGVGWGWGGGGVGVGVGGFEWPGLRKRPA